MYALLVIVFVLSQQASSTATSVVAPTAFNMVSLFEHKLAPFQVGRCPFAIKRLVPNSFQALRSNRLKPIQAARFSGESSDPNNTEVKELAEIGVIPVLSDIIQIFNMSEKDWSDIDNDEVVVRLSVFYRHLSKIQYAILTGSQAMASRHPEHCSKIIDGGSVLANSLNKVLMAIYRRNASDGTSHNQTPIKLNAMRLMAVSVYHHYLKQEIRACRSVLRKRYRHLTISEDLDIDQDNPYHVEVYFLHLALLTLALKPCALTEMN